MDKFDEFAYAAVKAVTRIKYGAEKSEIINDGKSVVFTIDGETKYASIQIFYYEDYDFTYNKDTFSGEIGVIQISPLYIRVFNRDKVKGVLVNNKKFIKKNEHGDMAIPFKFVKHLVTETKAEDND